MTIVDAEERLALVEGVLVRAARACVWCCGVAATASTRARRSRGPAGIINSLVSRRRRRGGGASRRRHRGDRRKIKDAAPNRARTRRPTATAGPLGTATPPRRARLFLQSRREQVNSLCRAGRAARICRCETSLLKTSYIKARRRPGRAASEAAAAAVAAASRAASAAVDAPTSCGGHPKPRFGAIRCPRKKPVP